MQPYVAMYLGEPLRRVKGFYYNKIGAFSCFNDTPGLLTGGRIGRRFHPAEWRRGTPEEEPRFSLNCAADFARPIFLN